MSKGHVHAELMAQYAEDAKETARPWERWQYKVPKDGYITCGGHPSWNRARVYRRKPTQVQVVGEVFEDVLLAAPRVSRPVFLVTLTLSVKEMDSASIGSALYLEGRVHNTYEGARRHLEALTPKVL